MVGRSITVRLRRSCHALQALKEGFREPAELLKHVVVEAVARAGAVYLSLDQPGVLEDLQVLTDRGLREWQLLNYISADASIHSHQQAYNLHPRRVRECLAQSG